MICTFLYYGWGTGLGRSRSAAARSVALALAIFAAQVAGVSPVAATVPLRSARVDVARARVPAAPADAHLNGDYFMCPARRFASLLVHTFVDALTATK